MGGDVLLGHYIYIYDILLDPNNHIPNTCLDMFKWSCMFSGVFLAIGLLEILHLHMGRCNTRCHLKWGCCRFSPTSVPSGTVNVCSLLLKMAISGFTH